MKTRTFRAMGNLKPAKRSRKMRTYDLSSTHNVTFDWQSSISDARRCEAECIAIGIMQEIIAKHPLSPGTRSHDYLDQYKEDSHAAAVAMCGEKSAEAKAECGCTVYIYPAN